MNIYNHLKDTAKKSKVHMTLIDPASQNTKRSTEIAVEAEKAGTDFFMIGGSTSIDMKVMDETIKNIKDRTKTPAIIFPGSSSMISRYADAIYFMSLLNSRNPDFIIGHQVKAAPFLKKMGVETIPMGYLVFKPGMTVGKVGEANLIDNKSPEPAVSYALAAQMIGMRLIYLEAGSGSPETIDPLVVSAVKKVAEVPLIVGGGIRDAGKAAEIASAGADIVVTGTIVEKTGKVRESLQPIIEAIKKIPQNNRF